MIRIVLFLVLVVFPVCSFSQTRDDSPTTAYKRLFSAVKKKDAIAVMSQMSAETLAFARRVAIRQGKPVEEIFENGLTATTMSSVLPRIRDEEILGDMGAVKVWNSKDLRWEDLPLVKEQGTWKFAFGELFAGTYRSPRRFEPFTIASTFEQPTKYGWHVINLDTGKLVFVGNGFRGRLSPTGEFLAIGNFEPPKFNVYVKKLPDGPLNLIGWYTPSDPESRPGIEWSADSESLKASDEDFGVSFYTYVDLNHRDYSISDQKRPLSKEASKILRRFDECWNVVHSPDNEWVAAICRKGWYQARNHSSGIFVFRTDGSKLTQITKNVSIKIKDGDDRDISWLPDGTSLIFERTSYEEEGL